MFYDRLRDRLFGDQWRYKGDQDILIAVEKLQSELAQVKEEKDKDIENKLKGARQAGEHLRNEIAERDERIKVLNKDIDSFISERETLENKYSARFHEDQNKITKLKALLSQAKPYIAETGSMSYEDEIKWLKETSEVLE